MNPAVLLSHRGVAAALAICVLALAPASASANTFTFTGWDVESGALANSSVSYGRSLGVLYTNPALLTGVRDQVGVNFMFNLPQMNIKLKPKSSYTNVPLSIYDSTIGNVPGLQDRALPTVELINKRADNEIADFNAYLGLGIAYNFGIKRLQLGGLVALPISSLNSAEIATGFVDEREANFSNKLHSMRFGEWNRIVAAVVGAAYQPLPWMDIGVSAQAGLSTRARMSIYIPDATVQNYSQTNAETVMTASMRPIVGLRFRPADWIALGITWRNESYVSVDGRGQLILWNYHEPTPDKTVPKRTNQQFPLALDYEPLEVSAGVGVHLKQFTTQVAVMWQQWSQYIDEHALHPQSYAAFPPSPFVDATNGGKIDPDEYRFSNTFNLMWSGQWRYKPWGEASLGFCWYPTPVPAQLGRSNFVDNDLMGFTAGQKFDFHIGSLPFTAALNLQVWTMFDRTTWKNPTQIYDEFPDTARTLVANNPMSEAAGLQTNNPGFPGYEAGGMLYAFGLNLIHTF
jgi:hypothetical protein